MNGYAAAAVRAAVSAALGSALLAALPAHAADAADAARGEQLYSRCIACHALARDRVGPRHCGVLGRRAGSVPGFAYTDEMKNSQLVWDEKTLDRFLAKPMSVVPGTSMTYDGVPEARDRADLIAYLRQAASGPECVRK